MTEPLLTSTDVAKLVGIRYRTLHAWVERGLLHPTHPARGSGQPSRWTPADLAAADRLARLRRAGLSMEGLQRALDEPDALRAELFEALEVAA